MQLDYRAPGKSGPIYACRERRTQYGGRYGIGLRAQEESIHLEHRAHLDATPGLPAQLCRYHPLKYSLMVNYYMEQVSSFGDQ